MSPLSSGASLIPLLDLHCLTKHLYCLHAFRELPQGGPISHLLYLRLGASSDINTRLRPRSLHQQKHSETHSLF